MHNIKYNYKTIYHTESFNLINWHLILHEYKNLHLISQENYWWNYISMDMLDISYCSWQFYIIIYRQISILFNTYI